MKKAAKNAWLRRHINDPYVQKAQTEGWRSRASFKLLELQKKYRFFRKGDWVIELGAAPGGWTQALRPLLGERGGLCAIDCLAMPPINGVYIIHGSIEAVGDQVKIWLESHQRSTVDWVISDMAPNISGVMIRDQACMIKLNEGALDYALCYLPKAGGRAALLMKCFHGVGTEAFFLRLKALFQKVTFIKPKASRDESREIYVLACDLR
jgi:23S rRNA (uridine2552-2'-O)-methyltransferase